MPEPDVLLEFLIVVARCPTIFSAVAAECPTPTRRLSSTEMVEDFTAKESHHFTKEETGT